MARQKGPLKLSGTIAGITFRQTKFGQVASRKSSLDKERVDKDPAFERSRISSRAFKLGGIYAGVLRRAFFKLMRDHADSRVTSRLTGKFMSMVMKDTGSAPMERKLTAGLLPQLKGFECNKVQSFSGIFPEMVNVKGNRQTKVWTATIPATETRAIKAPEGAKVYKVSVGVGAVDFEGVKGFGKVQDTGWISLKAHKEGQKELVFQVEDAGELPVISIAAVSFATESAGEYYPMANKSFNSAVLVGVDVV
jgi:hypothetical protein